MEAATNFAKNSVDPKAQILTTYSYTAGLVKYILHCIEEVF